MNGGVDFEVATRSPESAISSITRNPNKFAYSMVDRIVDELKDREWRQCCGVNDRGPRARIVDQSQAFVCAAILRFVNVLARSLV